MVRNASAIRSEIRSRAELNYALSLFCTRVSAPFTPTKTPRTDPLVQVDYARVADLDIRASKSDTCAIGGQPTAQP
jgi:hypothetical protein